MDWVTWKQGAAEQFRKYKYVAIILLAGIVLMALPEQKPPEPSPENTPGTPSLQQSLTAILSRVEGAGRVEVLLTEAAGERTFYQTDEDRRGEDVRHDTVLVSGTDRAETGLIRQIIPPTYQGAVVVCQGADNARVKLAVVEAVMSVTGLTSDKITVLKMK